MNLIPISHVVAEWKQKAFDEMIASRKKWAMAHPVCRECQELTVSERGGICQACHSPVQFARVQTRGHVHRKAIDPTESGSSFDAIVRAYEEDQ